MYRLVCFLDPPGGYLIYFGYWGRATQKDNVFHDFGIKMGLNFLKIGINKGIDFSKIGINFMKNGLIFAFFTFLDEV